MRRRRARETDPRATFVVACRVQPLARTMKPRCVFIGTAADRLGQLKGRLGGPYIVGPTKIRASSEQEAQAYMHWDIRMAAKEARCDDVAVLEWLVRRIE